MIQSPIVNEDGDWRFFITFVHNDRFDYRLFQILSDELLACDGESLSNIEKANISWEEEQLYSKSLTSSDKRDKLLRTHPALAARLFYLKQECIWNKILLGENSPLDRITDYLRRLEFQRGGTGHIHAIAATGAKQH